MSISDNGPSISYHLQLSTGKQQNETKQNKNDRNRWKGTGRPKSLRGLAATTPPLTPPRPDDSHRNHNRSCRSLPFSLHPKFSISTLICFRGRLSSQQRRREKALALFIKLLIAPQAKAASWRRQRDRNVRTKVSPNSHRTPCYVEPATLIQMCGTTGAIQCTIWLI